MLEITNAAASAAILAACDEGRLVQRQWHERGKDGRELACLLGAIHPSVTSPADCNGDLMPMWLAELTPTLFDGIAAEHMLSMARRYGELVARWHMLTPAGWDAIRTRFLIRTIDAAVEAATPVSAGKSYWPAVEAACEQVKTALATGKGLNAARAAAAAAAGAAAAAAARAAAAAAAGAAATWAAYLSLFTFLLDQIEAGLDRA
jgi:hypothetical protein